MEAWCETYKILELFWKGDLQRELLLNFPGCRKNSIKLKKKKKKKRAVSPSISRIFKVKCTGMQKMYIFNEH